MNNREMLYAILVKIPAQQTISYGVLAQRINIMYGTQLTGRVVGRLLSSMPRKDRDKYPRRRIVNRNGQVTSLKTWERGILQVQLLEAEGVLVVNEFVAKEFFQW